MTLALVFALIAFGCGKTGPTTSAIAESPEQAAARVFDLAQNLEKEHKSKEAFAAYHQVARYYPDTPQGKKAAQRISQAQKAALRKAK